MDWLLCRGLVLGLGVWLMALASPGAEQVILHLRDGDRLTGVIASENTNQVVITTLWNQQITLPVNQVVKREKVSPAQAPRPATNIMATANAAPAAKPAALPPKPKPPKNWNADLQFGLDLQKNTHDVTLYHTRARVNYTPNRFRNIFDYSYSYGETDGVLSANRMDGLAQSDFDLAGKKLFVSFVGSAGYDQIRKIDLYYGFGPALGYHVLTRTNMVLNGLLGMNYQEQDFSNGSNTRNFYYRLAEDFTWKLNAKLNMDQKFEFLPRAESFGQYRFRFETNFRFALLQNISLNLTVIDLYDSEPAKGVKPNDLQIRSAIGVRF